MVQSGFGQNETVQKGCADAGLTALGNVVEESVFLRPVDVEFVVDTRVHGGEHNGIPLQRNRQLTVRGFIEDLVDRFAIVNASLGDSSEFRSVGGGQVFCCHCYCAST